MISAVHQRESAIGLHMSPPSVPPFHLSPHPTCLGCNRAPALGSLHHTANSHWLSILHVEMYMFQCHSPKSSHPLSLPQSPKDCSIHQCLIVFGVQIFYLLRYSIGEGNDTPLQYSCLENPRTEEPGGLPSMGPHRVGHD